MGDFSQISDTVFINPVYITGNTETQADPQSLHDIPLLLRVMTAKLIT